MGPTAGEVVSLISAMNSEQSHIITNSINSQSTVIMLNLKQQIVNNILCTNSRFLGKYYCSALSGIQQTKA